MPHRSDEEALRAKLEERDRELSETRRELELAEKRLSEAEKEQERLRRGGPASASAPRSGLSRNPQVALLAVLVAFLVAGLVAAVIAMSRPMAPPVGYAPGAPPSGYGPAGYPPPSPIPPPRPAPPPPAAPVVVHLSARALAATGDTPVHAGDACTLTATITPGPALGLVDLVIECAGTRLYGSRDEVFGVSMTEVDAFAWPGEGSGTLRYEVTLSDTGPRSGRPEAVVRSWTGEGAVYQTGLGAFRVDLDVDPVSEAIPEPAGSAVRYLPGLPAHEIRHGRVVSAVPAGLEAGTACRVAVRPNPGSPGLNSRVHVRCGAATVYGAGTGGLAPRAGDVITDVAVTSEDGDPAITLDLAAGTVSIRDARGATNEAIEIALDPSDAAAPPPAAPAPAGPAPAAGS